MHVVFRPPFADLAIDLGALWLGGTDWGIVISTGWGGDPHGARQAGPPIAAGSNPARIGIEPLTVAGSEFQRIEAAGTWNSLKNLSVTARGLDAGAEGRLLVSNFVDVRIDLAGGGGGGFDILVIGAKRGLVRTDAGDGADRVTLISHSNEGTWANLFVIETFGGNDRIDVTTVARSQLDDVVLGARAQANGPLWNAAYDGRFSQYVIDAGAGDDIVTVRGAGSAVILGGAGGDFLRGGDGTDWIDGGQGTDVIFGGRGADIFVLRIGEIDVDVIGDFTLGEDVILFLGFSSDSMVMTIDAEAGLHAIMAGPGADLAFFLTPGFGGTLVAGSDYLFG
jgi:Ca2+-binding RTX toxin-like protein